MHQPWASLLVYGLKRVEGRAWPTEYTGRLWIHATSTLPTRKDIEVLPAKTSSALLLRIHEAEGRDVTPNLPKTYPTSVLIGCVDVVGCYSVSLLIHLSLDLHDGCLFGYITDLQLHDGCLFSSITKQQVNCMLQANDMEAWQTLPDTIKQEIGSPYCFLCENPKRLVVPQQMRGHPKLWQLPSKTATSLSAALKSPPDPVPFSWANYGRPDTADLGNMLQSSRSSTWYEQYGKARQQQMRKL